MIKIDSFSFFSMNMPFYSKKKKRYEYAFNREVISLSKKKDTLATLFVIMIMSLI